MNVHIYSSSGHFHAFKVYLSSMVHAMAVSCLHCAACRPCVLAERDTHSR